MPTAIPRWRTNHWDMSAITGPNVAEAPMPMNKCISANVSRLGTSAPPTKPMPSARVPNMIATMTPKRSHSRPMATPPKAKPIIASV